MYLMQMEIKFMNGKVLEEQMLAPGRNSIYERMLNSDINKANNITSRVFADFNLLEGLKLSIIGGYDLRNSYNKEYQNNVLGDAAPAGAASRETNNTYSVNFIQLLNYTKKIGSHNIDVLVEHRVINILLNIFMDISKDK
jgi:hypothetical protein